MPLVGTFIYSVVCALLQKIAIGWQGLFPSDWCRQCFTNPSNNKPLGNALQPLLGNQEYQYHRQHEVNSPAIILASKTAAPSYKDEEKRTGCFLKYGQLQHVVTKQSNGALSKNHPPSLKQMPDQHKAAKRKISFSPALRCRSVQTQHPCYLGSWLHSHYPNASLTRNSSLKNPGKTSSTLSRSLVI